MRNRPQTKNDDAWEELFDTYQIAAAIERDGRFAISAEQINVVREARLMTKFDHRSNLPQIFERYQLAILPITRGSYLIAHFDAYQDIACPRAITKIGFPAYLESLNYEHLTSEAAALNCAYLSGMLADFTGDEHLLPTVNGRMSSNLFNFEIRLLNHTNFMRVQVENAQIEIDGGYEGRRCFTLIEAKNSICENFLIRQLYYPFRLWAAQLTKPVKSVFLMYTNGIFTLTEYAFREPLQYNSLALVKQQNYRIDPAEIERADIRHVLQTTEVRPEPDLPFPQADSLRRIINLGEVLYEKTELTRDDITANYDFDVRQTNYYTDAGRYLGLISRAKTQSVVRYALTDEGQRLFTLKYKARQLKLVELILRHRIFHLCVTRCFEQGRRPAKAEIIELMHRAQIYHVQAETTFERRAATIAAWLDWIWALPQSDSQYELNIPPPKAGSPQQSG